MKGLGEKFEKEIREKIVLASNATVLKRWDVSEEFSNRKINLRQEEVSEIFKFGKYLNQLEPIRDENDLLRESNDFNSLKLIENEIIFDSNTKVKITSKESEKINNITKQFEKSKLKEKRTHVKKRKKSSKLTSNSIKGINSKIKTAETKPIHKELPKTEVSDFTISNLEIKKISHLKANIIVIGASVGGPNSIKTILDGIPKKVNSPILIVQHLNANFIKPFVRVLNEVTENKTKIAENMEVIQSDYIYIAPGDKHMEVILIENEPHIKIYEGDPVNHCIPSIDILFCSVANVYKDSTMGILLTGMGKDGVEGLGLIHKFSGITITESQETCSLYGMPKLAIEKGYAEYILPNYKIKDYIIKFSNLK